MNLNKFNLKLMVLSIGFILSSVGYTMDNFNEQTFVWQKFIAYTQIEALNYQKDPQYHNPIVDDGKPVDFARFNQYYLEARATFVEAFRLWCQVTDTTKLLTQNGFNPDLKTNIYSLFQLNKEQLTQFQNMLRQSFQDSPILECIEPINFEGVHWDQPIIDLIFQIILSPDMLPRIYSETKQFKPHLYTNIKFWKSNPNYILQNAPKNRQNQMMEWDPYQNNQIQIQNQNMNQINQNMMNLNLNNDPNKEKSEAVLKAVWNQLVTQKDSQYLGLLKLGITQNDVLLMRIQDFISESKIYPTIPGLTLPFALKTLQLSAEQAVEYMLKYYKE